MYPPWNAITQKRNSSSPRISKHPGFQVQFYFVSGRLLQLGICFNYLDRMSTCSQFQKKSLQNASWFVFSFRGVIHDVWSRSKNIWPPSPKLQPFFQEDGRSNHWDKWGESLGQITGPTKMDLPLAISIFSTTNGAIPTRHHESWGFFLPSFLKWRDNKKICQETISAKVIMIQARALLQQQQRQQRQQPWEPPSSKQGLIQEIFYPPWWFLI